MLLLTPERVTVVFTKRNTIRLAYHAVMNKWIKIKQHLRFNIWFIYISILFIIINMCKAKNIHCVSFSFGMYFSRILWDVNCTSKPLKSSALPSSLRMLLFLTIGTGFSIVSLKSTQVMLSQRVGAMKGPLCLAKQKNCCLYLSLVEIILCTFYLVVFAFEIYKKKLKGSYDAILKAHYFVDWV